MELLLSLLDGLPKTMAIMSESLAFKVLLTILVIIDVFFKAPALWRAARMGKPGWFVALFLLNTIGIFPAIFLFFTRKQYRALCGNGITKSCTTC